MVKEEVSKQNGKPAETQSEEKVQNVLYASFHTVWKKTLEKYNVLVLEKI